MGPDWGGAREDGEEDREVKDGPRKEETEHRSENKDRHTKSEGGT